MITQRAYRKKVDVVKMLIDMYDNNPELVDRKRQFVQDNAYELQYNLPEDDHNFQETFEPHSRSLIGLRNLDAYGVAMRNSLLIHVNEMTHKRKDMYMYCPNKGVKIPYFVDWCIPTNSSEDIREDH